MAVYTYLLALIPLLKAAGVFVWNIKGIIWVLGAEKPPRMPRGCRNGGALSQRAAASERREGRGINDLVDAAVKRRR